MEPNVDAHIVLDWSFLKAVIAFVAPIGGFIFVVSWKFSRNIVEQLVLLNEKARRNDDAHDRIEVNLKENCAAVNATNDLQWTKLVEHKVQLTSQGERIAKLEGKG